MLKQRRKRRLATKRYSKKKPSRLTKYLKSEASFYRRSLRSALRGERRSRWLLSFIGLMIVIATQNKELIWSYMILVVAFRYGIMFRWKRIKALFRGR